MTGLTGNRFTFLFTDIEGSTRLWEQYEEAMAAALASHDRLMRQTIRANGGQVFKTVGDAFYAVFTSASQALAAAVQAQLQLQTQCFLSPAGEVNNSKGLSEKLPEPLKVRMALHCGLAQERDGDYFGPSLNRVARLLAVGHGGQILLSGSAGRQVQAGSLPTGLILKDMGMRRLKDLSEPEQIFQVEAPDLPAYFQPLKTLDPRPSNLPAPCTSFVGRERELNDIVGFLSNPDIRWLSLTGPAGSGKSRLAQQAAACLLDKFEDGVLLVSLANIQQPEELAAALAHALNPAEALEGLPGLLPALRNRQKLLVLDDLPARPLLTGLLTALLAVAPGLKLLVCQQLASSSAAVQCYPVGPLLVDPTGNLKQVAAQPAVRLFEQRARAADPSFRLSSSNLRPIAQLCSRLKGLPLAIEQAAARIKLLPLAMLLHPSDEWVSSQAGEGNSSLIELVGWSEIAGQLRSNELTLFEHLAALAGRSQARRLVYQPAPAAPFIHHYLALDK